MLKNSYDSEGRVIQQTLSDGSSYHFQYVFDEDTKAGHADIIDPLGKTTRVIIHVVTADKMFYTVEKHGHITTRR